LFLTAHQHTRGTPFSLTRKTRFSLKTRSGQEPVPINNHHSTIIYPSVPSFLYRAPNPLPKTPQFRRQAVGRCLVETSGVEHGLVGNDGLLIVEVVGVAQVCVHDFKDPKLGETITYAVYDLASREYNS
jgi:hypothetical protein